MTSQCKAVLSELKKLTDNTECDISYLGGTTCFCLDDQNKTYNYQKYASEIDGIISLLVKEEYLTYTINEYNFKLTQKGIHKTQFALSKFGSYLSDKFIDILALVISIIALLNSYGYDVLAPLITLCKKLSGQ